MLLREISTGAIFRMALSSIVSVVRRCQWEPLFGHLWLDYSLLNKWKILSLLVIVMESYKNMFFTIYLIDT